MEYDDLELDTLGDRKTALFVIISDTDDTVNFVVAMMYSQLFNLLCDKADDKYGGRLPVHVRCLLDEFSNIGKIPNFEKLIATIRSREISACIILQAQSQLVLQILSYVAQTEREFIRKRQAEGIAAAKARGVHFGVTKKPMPEGFDEAKAAWQRGEISLREAAAKLQISHMTFYRRCTEGGDTEKS